MKFVAVLEQTLQVADFKRFSSSAKSKKGGLCIQTIFGTSFKIK
jgi:hypothetical protein